jgi:peptidoglycan/xylan/chitin deacetylase (PgdA/CDA1 family)
MRPIAVLILGALVGCSSSEDGPESEPIEPPEPGTAIVSLTFDDTLPDHQVAVDLLDERGMRGTFYVNSKRVDRTGYLSAEQLAGWQEQGHEIAGHTIDHVNLAEADPEEARRQICDDRAALVDVGFSSSTSFAYPFGATNDVVEQIAAECGYTSARGVGGRSNPIPPPDPFNILSAPPVDPETTLEDLQAYVADGEADGGWVPIVFHHVCDGCSTNAISPDTLAAFLDWLAEEGKAVHTMGEVMAAP